MAYSKLARARSNCYKDGDYGGNIYGGSHHRDGHFAHRSQMGIGNFSSYAKAFDHIPYEDCYEKSPYDVRKGYHGSHDYSDQNCGDANHRTFGFLGNNSYDFDGSLFSLLGDHYVKFQGEVVKHLQYVLASLDPYVIGFDELNRVEKPLLLVKGLIVKSLKGLNFSLWRDAKLEQSCFDIKCWHDILDIISLVVDSFPSWTPMWGMIPSYFLDPFVGNFLVKKVEGNVLHTLSLLKNNYYVFYESLIAFIGDPYDKFQGEFVEKYAFLSLPLGPYVLGFVEYFLVGKPLLLANGMTQDKHENVETFQGPVTRSIKRKIEEKNKRMVTLFKNFRGLTWNAMEGENEDQRSPKTVLMSIMQVKKAKGISLEDLEYSISNGEKGWNPNASGKVHPTIHGRVMAKEEKIEQYLPPKVGSRRK
ncbi:hypothetical protein M9H77_17587 [Catharanthus roseus]|uniref:Uncharacterized protein n=1 Tax=Catharanthus roseus TaxID=4058 RepID=A0ACC0B533_CATRO|nr:hypothetical protein M9H77_17587 [Catharanthus roseus]